ncbi:PepSY domain-containing protein [Campylobacter concisus]
MKFLNQKFFYKLHTYLSLLFFIPLVVVCFSGAILVYKDELNSLLAPNVINVN